MVSFVFRVRAVRLFGISLVLAGLLLGLCSSTVFSWQVSARLQGGSWVPLPLSILFEDRATLPAAKAARLPEFLPELGPSWLADLEAWPIADAIVMALLNKLSIGLVLAVCGVAVAALGALVARRQKARLHAAKRRREDRLRRLRQYRDNSRVEPFIGPHIASRFDAVVNAAEGPGTGAIRRRVA